MKLTGYLTSAALILSTSFIANAQWNTSTNDIYNSNTGNVGIGTATQRRNWM
jgi:hypothetical protein